MGTKKTVKLTINEQTKPVIAEIAEHMPGGFFIYKGNGNKDFLYFNQGLCRMCGCKDSEEFIEYTGNSFLKIVHPDDLDDVLNLINRQVNNGITQGRLSYRILQKNGNVRYVSDFGHRVLTEQYGEVYYVFIVDDTENQLLIEAEKTAFKLSLEQQKIEGMFKSNDVSSLAKKAFEGIRVLLVDDDVLSRTMNCDVLVSEGATVVEADTGIAALRIYKNSQNFDAILMDINMPIMDGIEAAKEIRAFEKTIDSYVPIIGLCISSDEKLEKRCIEAGFSNFIAKKININDFSKVLINAMREQSNILEKRLSDTIRLANTDILTKVKNIAAYTDKTGEILDKMRSDTSYQFGIIMCDINGLKVVNDNFGHEIGDKYIKNCCNIICDAFVHSPVYRIGGDEFVVILEGKDYLNRDEHFESMINKIKASEKIEHYEDGKASFAAGLAIYEPAKDHSVSDVFKRADMLMYKYKKENR